MTRQIKQFRESSESPRKEKSNLMYSLLLMRHAKSSWDDPNQEDFDRPLNPRGVRTARFMADYMVQRRLIPTKIICSTARRTRETLAILARVFKYKHKVEMLHELYSGTALDYQRMIRKHGLWADRLLVIAHNPCIQEATIALSDETNREVLARVAAHFPTCGLAIVNFDMRDWRELLPKSGNISEFYRPKEMPNYPKSGSSQCNSSQITDC